MKLGFLRNFSIIQYFWIFIVPFFLLITFIYSTFIWKYNISNSISSLKVQSSRIEKSFSESADYTIYMMDYINNQIVNHGENDLHYIKELLASFRLDKSVNNIIPWNMFSWVNSEKKLVVNSDKGIVSPSDLSNRDYIKKTYQHPGLMEFGDLRYGAVSNKLIIPSGMSVANKHGKVIGTMVFGFQIDMLTFKLSNAITSKGISFALFDENLKTILTSKNFVVDQEINDSFKKINTSKHPSGKLTDFKLFSSKGVLRYYQKVSKYPYYVVVQYDRDVFMNELLSKIVPYFIQLFFILISLLIIVVWFKKLIINPVSHISLISKIIITDSKAKTEFPRSKVREINQLSKSILSIKKFVKNEEVLKHKLIKANEDLQSLTRSISHDIRNYIFGISGIAGLILDKKLTKSSPKLTSDEEDMLKIIIHQSEEVGYFVEDLLDSSQIAAGNFVLKDVIKCDISSLVHKVMLVNQSFALDNKVKILFDKQGDVPLLGCDPRRMRQILMNLVSNAIKYNKENGEVTIILKADSDNIYIEIIDTGIGMSDDEIKMALEGDGKKIDKNISRKSHIKSHGIGMLTIRHLVELHQGKIAIESKSNVGTKVKLSFNIYNQIKGSNGSVKNAVNTVMDFTNTKKVKILLVDDNHFNLILIKGVLRRENYQIIEAIDGKEGLDILEKEPDINLIIMDGKMSVMDGYETTKIIRSGVGFKNFKNYNIPIIGLMGDGDQNTIQKAKDSGMNEHFQKGSAVFELIDVVKGYINKKF